MFYIKAFLFIALAVTIAIAVEVHGLGKKRKHYTNADTGAYILDCMKQKRSVT